jgi:DNA-binding GntR family transcriptional regulator
VYDDFFLPWLGTRGTQPIAERTAAELARRITEGELEGGTLLTEVELAAEFEASRTPMREAVLALQSWGLVRLLPKKGALVTVPTTAERRDLLALRSMLERTAVDALDDDRATDLSYELTEVLDAQRYVLNDPHAFAELDHAFHLRVILSGGNAVVAEMLRGLAPRLVRLTHLAAVSVPSLDTFLQEHRELAAAIADGRTADHARLLADHLAAGHAGYEVAR